MVVIQLSDRQIDAVSYELAEAFFKRIGYSKTPNLVDSVAATLSDAIHKWLKENSENPEA